MGSSGTGTVRVPVGQGFIRGPASLGYRVFANGSSTNWTTTVWGFKPFISLFAYL